MNHSARGHASLSTPRRPDLRELMARLRDARLEAQRMRQPPASHEQLRAAQSELLSAMQDYCDELTERSLPIPPQLRDDMRMMSRTVSRGR